MNHPIIAAQFCVIAPVTIHTIAKSKFISVSPFILHSLFLHFFTQKLTENHVGDVVHGVHKSVHIFTQYIMPYAIVEAYQSLGCGYAIILAVVENIEQMCFQIDIIRMPDVHESDNRTGSGCFLLFHVAFNKGMNDRVHNRAIPDVA